MSISYQKPTSLPEALALRAASDARHAILAGGTDLIVQWRQGARELCGLIDISGMEELQAIVVGEEAVEIGALVTHARIIAHEAIARHLPALAEASATIGAVQIQNVGTIGGNVMNASPAGDTIPALMAYDALFLAQDLTGERWIPASGFFPGYRRTALRPQELLTRIRIPLPKGEEQARFLKIGARRAQAISKVSLCARVEVDHGGIRWIRIVAGSCGPTVVRARGTEALLTGKAVTPGLIDKARASLADEIAPIDDVRSTADYRRFAAGGLLARYLREATMSPPKKRG